MTDDQDLLARLAIANALNTTGPSRCGLGEAPLGTIPDRDPETKVLLGWTKQDGTYVKFKPDETEHS